MKQHEHAEHKGPEHENSIEEAGGAAVGFTGSITGFNADAQARMADALYKIGKWVGGESGVLLGHIKCAIYREDGSGVTLNLIDMDNGVEIHGTLEPSEKVAFTLMCAVLDVDPAELDHTMHHVLEDTNLDIELEHHDCHCHGHEHEHEDLHEHGNGHEHHHGHGHEGHHHHDDDDDESCGHRGGCCNHRNHSH
ncbi:MAG: hydrogenase nickel incorporation protein HypA [Candidatus Methanomethylophilaceae archaeon]|jgi:hypothetical protein|nr:hydrogenase nickel incorporation protein HypA [Candidatus Methanomethylophilaceae archaeon]MDD3987070.1 hydrogenase nickel incorporation protein HypA [Candidatus Methanomethylophilaceae archaeon]